MKGNAGKESRKAAGKVPNDLLLQRMSSTESGTLKKCEPPDTRDFVPYEVFEGRVRSFTMLPLVCAPSWPPIEDLPAQNSSRLRVAKYTSFVFFLVKRMSTASLLRKM